MSEETLGLQIESPVGVISPIKLLPAWQTVGEFTAVPHLPHKTYGHLTKLLYWTSYKSFSPAQRVLDEADEIAKKVNYPTPYMAADERARLLIATGQAGKADSALDAFHPSTPAPGALELDSWRVHVSRAEDALARGDNEVAAQLAAKVLQELAATNARDYVKWLEARAAFVQGRADLQLGHPRDALPLLQRSVELRQSTVDAVSPALAVAQIGLADCYLDLGDPVKAIPLITAAKQALASHRDLGSQYLQPLHSIEKRLRQVTRVSQKG